MSALDSSLRALGSVAVIRGASTVLSDATRRSAERSLPAAKLCGDQRAGQDVVRSPAPRVERLRRRIWLKTPRQSGNESGAADRLAGLILTVREVGDPLRGFGIAAEWILTTRCHSYYGGLGFRGLQRQTNSDAVVQLELFVGDWVLLVTARDPVFWGLQRWLALADDGLQRLSCGIPAESTRSTTGADVDPAQDADPFRGGSSRRAIESAPRRSRHLRAGSAAAVGMTTEARGRPRRLPSGPRAPDTGDAPSRRRIRVRGCSARPPTLTRSDHRVTRECGDDAATDSSGRNTDGSTLPSPTNLDSPLGNGVASKMLPGRACRPSRRR